MNYPSVPHRFCNEDGKWQEHEGYEIKECVVCKAMFPVTKSRAAQVRTCGRQRCDGIQGIGAVK